MLAKELISDIVVSIKTSTTGLDALNQMDDLRVSHMPIVNNLDFLGLISDEDIYAMEDQNEAIGSMTLSLFSPFVFEYQHIYEIVELVSRLKLSLVPVLNDNKQYLGCILIQDLVQSFSSLIAADHCFNYDFQGLFIIGAFKAR